jgi:hypothetical protein
VSHIVSPNSKPGAASFFEAFAMLKGRGHTNALRFYSRVEKRFGNLGYVSTAIGQWQGLEATTITDDPFSNRETLLAKAVLKALYSAQLGTALFIPDHPPNNGTMYQLTFARATPQAVSHRLSEAGLAAWTIIFDGAHTRQEAAAHYRSILARYERVSKVSSRSRNELCAAHSAGEQQC